MRKPSLWTNFSALPALYTSQRDKERERETERVRKRESEKEGERDRDRDRGALAPFSYLVII